MRCPVRRVPPALALAAALAAASQASAGVVVTVASTEPGATRPEIATISLEADRLRAESSQGSFIYRADRKLAWVLQPAEKSYLEITEQQAAQLGGMVAQVQAQLAALPAEQRAMVEQMMASQVGGQVPPGMMGALAGKAGPTEPTTFVPTGKKETINGWACSSYDAQRAGVTTEELWVTPFEGFDVKEADFAVLRSLTEFASRMSGPMAKQLLEQPVLSAFGGGADAPPGVPVRTQRSTGRGSYTTEIQKVERGAVPAGQFELPDGWTKKQLLK